jgi:hypothetical protein
MRTHRVRPSEKRTLRVIPGFTPQGLSPRLAPREGAGSARPQGGLALDRDMGPVGPRAIFNACGGKEMPWHSFGRTKRTHRVRPSEKIAYPRTSPRQAISPGSLHPAEGRAPHARKGGITLTPTLLLLGHRLLVKAPVATQCLAIRPAVPCGRGDRAPPRKPHFAFFPAFPR